MHNVFAYPDICSRSALAHALLAMASSLDIFIDFRVPSVRWTYLAAKPREAEKQAVSDWIRCRFRGVRGKLGLVVLTNSPTG